MHHGAQYPEFDPRYSAMALSTSVYAGATIRTYVCVCLCIREQEEKATMSHAKGPPETQSRQRDGRQREFSPSCGDWRLAVHSLTRSHSQLWPHNCVCLLTLFYPRPFPLSVSLSLSFSLSYLPWYLSLLLLSPLSLPLPRPPSPFSASLYPISSLTFPNSPQFLSSVMQNNTCHHL